jgi:hypothetical protein
MGLISCWSVAKLKYFGTTVTIQNLIQEEIRRRLNSGNAGYHSVHNLCLLVRCLKTLKIKMYESLILPVDFYGCETWSPKLREELRLRVFSS